MSTEHRDPIGLLGAYGVCPKCGSSGVNWDPVTDISRCACGWSNEKQAADNLKKRKRNGEL